MRLWSVHPKYLDARGLVALWREGLLAQRVLTGTTKGYRNHPQLDRFKKTRDPLASLGAYLYFVAQEAAARDYRFDASKILKLPRNKRCRMPVKRGQLQYEAEHLAEKLKVQDPKKWSQLKGKTLSPHPTFYAVQGPVEPWERAPDA